MDWGGIDLCTRDDNVQLMKRYLEQRNAMAPGRLFHLRSADLDARPLEILPGIYETLDLGDFESVRPRMERYLASLGKFEKNSFDFPSDVIETVNEHWGFAFEALGYERVEPGQSLD